MKEQNILRWELDTDDITEAIKDYVMKNLADGNKKQAEAGNMDIQFQMRVEHQPMERTDDGPPSDTNLEQLVPQFEGVVVTITTENDVE